MLKIKPRPFVLFIGDFARIILDEWVEKYDRNKAKQVNEVAHVPHAGGHLSADKVDFSSIVAVDCRDVVRVDALIVDHSEEDVSKTCASDDDSID
jgi:hypothetical protein